MAEKGFAFCERCGAKLSEFRGGKYNIVWLEYDIRTGTYTDQDVPPEHSQGAFPFGKDCAKIELEENKKNVQEINNG